MRPTLKEKERQYRTIYDAIFRTPRVPVYEISSLLQIDRNTVSRRMKEAFDLEIIVGPQLRKRSYSNLKEYVYFVRSNEPEESYSRYCKDNNVVYHAIMDGFADLWITSNKELDIEGNIIVGGVALIIT